MRRVRTTSAWRLPGPPIDFVSHDDVCGTQGRMSKSLLDFESVAGKFAVLVLGRHLKEKLVQGGKRKWK